MFTIEIALFVGLLLVLFYKWSTANYGVLRERGIPHHKPIPLLGNVKIGLLLGQSSLFRASVERYLRFRDSKVYGVYNMRQPMIFVRDTELLKKICIKDFDNFANHRIFLSADDGVFSKSLISLRDRKWKAMRSILTPSFSGVKLRLMYSLIGECCTEAVKYLDQELELCGGRELDLEMKDFFTRFTNDVIASSAFGVKVNSFRNKSNEFYTFGKEVTQLSTPAVLKSMLYGLIPNLMKALGVKIFDEAKINYFRNLVFDTIKHRQEHNIVRPDIIQLLLEAKHHFAGQGDATREGQQHAFDDDDLLAQCLIFFFAGFETISTCLCFTTYELLMNPSVQQRLHQEIVDVEASLAGKALDYDTLMQMPYMDMVVAESLRKWPPITATDRVCLADYQLKDEQGDLVAALKKDDMVLVPIAGLHYDPQNFPKPEEFDPDRFSERNKHLIKPMSYLPFGIGPRLCIGKRLALMEVKSAIYHILLRYEIVAAAKTTRDMINSIRGFQMKPRELFWMKVVPRKGTTHQSLSRKHF